MSADVLTFPSPAAPSVERNDALLAAVAELHALITIDPMLGASPVRVYFVFNPEAKGRIAASLGQSRPAAGAYALVAYDFPYAVHLIETSRPRTPTERAKAVVALSAELQNGLIARAAAGLGVRADPVTGFDADGLKTTFFPRTQESVIGLFQLGLFEELHPCRP